MDITQFLTDPNLENQGRWIDGPDGSKFKIRSADSKQYRRAMLTAARAEPANKLRKDPETQRRVTIAAMAEAILLDWSGVTNGGKELPCTLENRLALLAISELRDHIATEAQDSANFRTEGQAADAAELKSGD